MDWLTDVRKKLERKNQILFSKDNPLIVHLNQIIQQQNRRVLVFWALELAEYAVEELEEKYSDSRPRNALETTRSWASGNLKMPVAKKEILNCHAMAKELSDQADIALCHAIGQACGVVHTPGHALGHPIYELTAIVRKYGIDDCKELVEERFQFYIDRLNHWKDHEKEYDGTWAHFLMK